MGHKKIGLLGGTAPESTVSYYRYLTREYAHRFGDYGFPEILIYSVNFQELMDLGHAGRWDRVADQAVEVFDALQRAGADFGLMTANTMHIVFNEVVERTKLPLLSIVDATVEVVADHGIDCLGLLGTADTMNGSFYPDTLDKHRIATLIPEPQDRELISRVIYDELALGEIKKESKREYLRIIADLQQRGAGGVILACTEVPLLVKQEDLSLPLFDTMEIHADMALRMATGSRSGDG
jgi:aspartate racemase